ncbi:hypothetical protein NC653_027164 [Populus alba x Populus x berolinensis]|uniref:Uncharacterized protein n=1 Tax=Populus alba x Populus x berolinensis TaxID=444605 RepID=A0AAD6M5J3_9ROSI|nr:hypothetical protein NC653_027164 [Populus alba x Populus x berolinensis]
MKMQRDEVIPASGDDEEGCDAGGCCSRSTAFSSLPVVPTVFVRLLSLLSPLCSLSSFFFSFFCFPGLLELMDTMTKLWLTGTACSPLLLLLLSFTFSSGSGNAEGSSSDLVTFLCLCVWSVCLLGFPVERMMKRPA